MKFKMLLPALLLVNGLAFSQGVQFESTNVKWADIQAKAKAEHKYIFMDFYATWCGPCKKMDADVYPAKELGDFMNPRFISVKVQIDSSKQDNKEIKSWYADARQISQQYQITAMPSFLFFDPEGKIVHREVGFKSVNDMLVIAKAAQIPQEQYYGIIEKYNAGIKDYPHLGELAVKAREIGDKETANKIAIDYMDNYLVKLPETERYSKKNIEFVLSFLSSIKSSSKIFGFFYPNGSKADQGYGRSISLAITNYIISKENIEPILGKAQQTKSETIDWKKIENSISTKYGWIYAENNVLMAKARWYEYISKTYNKDWDKYIGYRFQVIRKFETDTTDGFMDINHNNFFYEAVFLHGNDLKQLSDAIELEKGIIRRTPIKSDMLPVYGNNLDTYASLIYKSGRKEEAIAIEEIAHQLAPLNRSIEKMLGRMTNGEKIWLPK